MTQLDPYLVFGGQARAAMEHYHAVLGGRLDVMTFGDMGATGPEPPPDGVMHALLVTESGLRLMASDGPPGEEITHGNDFGIALSGEADDEAEIRGWYDAFAAAGTVDVPLEPQMWGALFGQVTDSFGVAWMFNIASGQEPSGQEPTG